jgi:hypothetical protein
MFNASHSSHNWKKRKLFFIFIIPLLFLALSGIVMLLWNAILPDVIHVGVINYWQALGLLALCRILFGGFGFRGGHGSDHFAKAGELREKWSAMTDEEKQKFKEEYKARCLHRRH